jgi:hypothetical protein
MMNLNHSQLSMLRIKYLAAIHQFPEASVAAASKSDSPISATVGAMVNGVMYLRMAPINPVRFISQRYLNLLKSKLNTHIANC